MARPLISDYPDYYLGWVIQPTNVEGTKFYVYERDDTNHPKGFFVEGPIGNAMRFIEDRTKFS